MADNYVEYHRQEYEQWKARRERKRQAALRRRLAEIMARRAARPDGVDETCANDVDNSRPSQNTQ